MQFTREINRLFLGFLASLIIIGLTALYWAVVGPDTLLLREDNPRRVEAEAAIARGGIYDRSETLLATTESRSNRSAARHYLEPAAYSALGYYSLRYGVGGAEAAYDAILRGDTLERDLSGVLTRGLLHQPQQGSDVQLTLDLSIQQQLVAALGERRGAAVMIGVPNGEVLAMVSLPTFDPNTLDQDWERLIADAGNPFFNRVLQGQYQPGGAMQIPLMAGALLLNLPLDSAVEGATESVIVDDLTLGCAVRLPEMDLSLREAFIFTCPKMFADFVSDQGPETLDAIWRTFNFGQQSELNAFVANNIRTPAAVTTPEPVTALDSADLLATAMGQGALTVSPMTMALLAAAIANDGNAPQPYILAAQRPPNAEAWGPVEAVRPSVPVTTTNNARRLQDLMRNAVVAGAAQNAGRPAIDIGGHASLAYSGDETQSWFVGFATLGGRRGVAIAVVLEDTDDPGLAADIGGGALAAAQAALVTPTADAGS